jgi:cobalt/nickel transport system ATP-binding protein
MDAVLNPSLAQSLIVRPDKTDGDVTPVFELEEVSFSYGQAPLALHAVNLRVDPGDRIAVLGANGSGKSTLLKLLDALYFPTGGTLRAFGQAMTPDGLSDEATAIAFRRRVGLVFQDPDVQLFSPTVWDEVTFAPMHLGLSRVQVIERAEWAMGLLGIEKLRDRAPHRLSGGEKKKVALASVLSLQPEVWLLDEPTAGLDPRSTSRLLDFLDDLKWEGKTVITATHTLDIVEEISDRVLMFSEEHEIMVEGEPRQVLADEAQLIACNLIHEHRHQHGGTEHVHPHLHAPPHEHTHSDA